MITARKNRLFEFAFARYNRNLLARKFHAARVCGLEHLETRAMKRVPLLLYANHSSWWDGLVAFQIGYANQLEQYLMMEEKQLRAYPLFRRLGCFSVVREDARQALRSIKYASELLKNSNRALWILPQGEIKPNDIRPLAFQSGTAHIVKRIVEGGSALQTAPVAMRYEHLGEFRPEIFVRIGEPETFAESSNINAPHLTENFERRLTQTLERVREDVLHARFDNYQVLIAPRK